MPNKLLCIQLDKPIDGLYHQCQRVTDNQRCGADSSWLVTQKGELTGRTFNLHLCEHHAAPYYPYVPMECRMCTYAQLPDFKCKQNCWPNDNNSDSQSKEDE